MKMYCARIPSIPNHFPYAIKINFLLDKTKSIVYKYELRNKDTIIQKRHSITKEDIQIYAHIF